MKKIFLITVIILLGLIGYSQHYTGLKVINLNNAKLETNFNIEDSCFIWLEKIEIPLNRVYEDTLPIQIRLVVYQSEDDYIDSQGEYSYFKNFIIREYPYYKDNTTDIPTFLYISLRDEIKTRFGVTNTDITLIKE